MTRFKRLMGTTLAGLLLAGFAGCGGGTGTGGTFGSAETLAFEGWDNYRRGGDDKRAEELFRNALSLDPNFSEAHNGLGWINFRRAGQAEGEAQQQLLSTAKASFERATATNPQNTDAWVGLAGVELALGNWEAVINWGTQALDLSPRYFSPHDNIDFRDVRVMLAEAFFFTGAFVDTQQTPDPNNTLHQLDLLSPGYKKFYHDNELTPPDLILKIEELQKS